MTESGTPQTPPSEPPGEPPSALSMRKQRALQLLVKGLSDTRVAREVGVARETVNRWRLHDPAFREALEAEGKRQWAETVKDVSREQIEAVMATKPLSVEGIKARLELKDCLLLADLADFNERRVKLIQRLETAIEQSKFYLDTLSKDESVTQQVVVATNDYKLNLMETLTRILDEDVPSSTTRDVILDKLRDRMKE